MYWHYQVMRHTKSDDEVYYGIHEYYPFEDGTAGYTERSIVDDLSFEDLIATLENMLKDAKKYGVKEYND